MKEKINVAAVSYLNTVPFLYGIQNDKDLMSQINLRLEYPSRCADLLKSGEVDISLIPIVEIPDIPTAEIIGGHCIGSEGKVKTVMLYSDCPLEEIKTIALDYQSRTSVVLAKVLAKNYWNIDFEFEETTEGYIDTISGTRAGVVIGDRAFDLKDSFSYQYDLSEEWYKFTGLPFVFACWVANKPLSDEFKQQFDRAVKYGLDHKNMAIEVFDKKENSSINLKRYLNEHISCDFDQRKKTALKKFLSLSKDLLVTSDR